MNEGYIRAIKDRIAASMLVPSRVSVSDPVVEHRIDGELAGKTLLHVSFRVPDLTPQTLTVAMVVENPTVAQADHHGKAIVDTIIETLRRLEGR